MNITYIQNKLFYLIEKKEKKNHKKQKTTTKKHTQQKIKTNQKILWCFKALFQQPGDLWLNMTLTNICIIKDQLEINELKAF